MSNEVKRYDPINSDGTCGMCIEDADYGAYVEYADYAALETELERSAQQPHSAEAVAWTWQGALDQLKGYCPEGVAVFGHKGPGVPIPLYTTPQPSAGVVMPGRAEVSVRYGYRSMGYAEGWNDCLDEVASLNGKEVGRG